MWDSVSAERFGNRFGKHSLGPLPRPKQMRTRQLIGPGIGVPVQWDTSLAEEYAKREIDRSFFMFWG